LVSAVECAEQIVLFRPLHVIAHHEVEFSVAVVIDPSSAGGELVRSPESRGLCDIGKSAVAVVVKEMVLTDGGDEEVVEAVVIVVPHRDTETEYRDSKAGFASDIGERAIAVVVIELESGQGFLMAWKIPAVDQQDVGRAIIVIVDEGAAWAN